MNINFAIIPELLKTVAIGDNGSSEFIAIQQLYPGNYRVVLSPLIDIDAQYHIEIGTSFTDMLTRLADGQEWFK